MNPPKFSLLLTFFLAGLGLILWSTALPAHSQGSPATDLALQKSVSPVTVLEPGDAIQYTLVFSNAGVLTATDVLITDTFPVLLMDVSVTSTLALTPTGAAWAVGDLPPGQGGVITLTAFISPALTSEGWLTNTASVSGPITDTQPANNTSFVVSEVNLPPVVEAGPDQTAFVGESFTLNATFSDPGLDDTHAAVLTWGDGLTETLSSVTSPFTVTHVYTATDAFTVTLLVTDSDGGTGEDSLGIIVENGSHILWLPIIYKANPMDEIQVYPSPNRLISYTPRDISAIYGASTYGLALLPGTVTTETFILQSFQTGIVTGTVFLDYSYPTHVYFDLSYRNFQPGEVLQATLTTGVGALYNENGIPILLHPSAPTVWQVQVPSSG